MSETSFPSSRARSCKNCATAKAKCYGFVSSKCERCNRLNKECIMQTIIRKPKPAKITRTAQIAQLEQKLDGLVSILTKTSNVVSMHDEISMNAAHSLAGLSQNSGSRASPDDHLSYSDAGASHTGQLTGSGTIQVTLPRPSFLQRCAFKDVFLQPVALHTPPLRRHTSSSQTPEQLLEIFRTHLARQVSFVVVPAHITALELQEERPFLYGSIIFAASCNDASHQIALGNEILRNLADALLVRGEKSLDLLQGLLVFISWYQYNFHINMQLNNLLGLMHALVVDLGLHKPAPVVGKVEVFVNDMKRTFRRGMSAPKSGYERSGPRTMDDKRALLGCFYLSSCITSMMPSSYIDPMRAIPYIEECCEVVQAKGGELNDEFMVQLARLQFLSEKIRLSGVWEIAMSPEDASSRASLSMYVQTFQGELQRFFSSVPKDVQDDKSFLLHYHITSMQLYEIGFYMPPTTSSLYLSGCKMKRVDTLRCLLASTKAFLDEFLPIPPRSYFSLNMIHCGQMMYAMGDLAKLSLFKADDWDPRLVRATVDLASVEDHIISRMEEAASIFESDEENGLWSISARRLRKVKKIAKDREREQSAETAPIQDAQATLPSDNFDLFEDSFWQGISGDAWQFID